MFVSTNQGEINLAHVAKIGTTWPRDGKARATLYAADGTSLGVAEDPDFDLATLTAPIVPAAPGSTVVLIHSLYLRGNRPEAGDVWAEQVPVLAWRCLSLGAFPVTLDDEDLRHSQILHPLPDGRFLAPGNRTFETIEQAVSDTLRDMQEDWDRRHGQQGERI